MILKIPGRSEERLRPVFALRDDDTVRRSSGGYSRLSDYCALIGRPFLRNSLRSNSPRNGLIELVNTKSTSRGVSLLANIASPPTRLAVSSLINTNRVGTCKSERCEGGE